MNKLLSVIVPTRNRQIYCIDAVKTILKDLDERCELVIQDNSSDDCLRKQLENLADSRIVYNYNPQPLSFIDNFEEAINLSSGDFFIVLGDDDSTTKDTVKIVEWMQENNIDSVASTKVVDYIWPNSNIEKYNRGLLSYYNYNKDIQQVNALEQLKKLIQNGFLAYQMYDLPRTYHGIIRKSCMDEVKNISGKYFGGLTPDIYSTIALSCIVKKHYVIDYPFSIAGACPASATVNATVGGHSGKLEDAPHFKNRGPYLWENIIPAYYSVETIWAESAIKALKCLDRADLLTKFDMYKLYIYGILLNRKYILRLSMNQTLKLYSKLDSSLSIHILKISVKLVTVMASVLKKRIIGGHKPNKAIQTDSVYSLDEAKKILNESLKSVEWK
ncbi:glycosyltransferase family 2 protein [Acinetobacter seifertii]|uniref:glycosyltransferase family 2 protein n=1 Tax=Acinetobacter seifertii TaxID=1530123 RepID=UPI000A300F58|nr:glycosyltransferase [Acinetobacter seifertii]OUC60282.1 glycosyl transferase 2 [Acinetobacter seifertii]